MNLDSSIKSLVTKFDCWTDILGAYIWAVNELIWHAKLQPSKQLTGLVVNIVEVRTKRCIQHGVLLFDHNTEKIIFYSKKIASLSSAKIWENVRRKLVSPASFLFPFPPGELVALHTPCNFKIEVELEFLLYYSWKEVDLQVFLN